MHPYIPVFVEHEVQDQSRRCQEEDLHGSEVNGKSPAVLGVRFEGEQLKVSSQEDDKIQQLRFEAQTTRVAARPDRREQYEDASQVGHIRGQTEDVHGWCSLDRFLLGPVQM